MGKNALLWVVSFVLTASSAAYQRITGPTYPVSGKVTLQGQRIDYRLRRTHSGSSNHVVELKTGDPRILREVLWKRYPSSEEWSVAPMRYRDGALSAELPWQPPAGKLEYRVKLATPDSATVLLPESRSAVIRFKGDVPIVVLILHIVAMFGAMLLSTRAGLEYFSNTGASRWLVPWTIAFLIVGGVVLGPLVQKYAFGAYWTGWPYGTDLTDNKTAIALIGWAGAFFVMRRSRRPQVWALLAAVLLLAVFLIPHSVLGSELKYENGRPAPSQLGP